MGVGTGMSLSFPDTLLLNTGGGRGRGVHKKKKEKKIIRCKNVDQGQFKRLYKLDTRNSPTCQRFIICQHTSVYNKPVGDDGPILPPFYSTKARTENLSPENFL